MAVCLATIMLLLDVTIVNVALPAIERDLGASFSDLQWVVDAYSLTLAAILLTAGSLSDLVGRKRVFVGGLVLFTVASALCGLSGSPLILNLSRGLQGIGASGMFACGLALLAAAYQGRDRGTAIGIWGASIGAAVAIGPLVGGVLTDGIGWQAIFFVNVPIGLGLILLTLRTVQDSRNPAEGRLDLPGVVTFSASLFLFVFCLIRGNDEGWGSPLITGMLAGAAVLLAAFLVIERRSRHPMLELPLFRNASFVGASVGAFALSASQFAMFLYLTLYIQNQLDYSPLEAGLRFLPTTVLSFVVAPFAGKLAERVGIRWFMGVGLIVCGIGLFTFTGLQASDEWTALLPGFILGGIGVGMVNPALATAAVGVVAPVKAGMASGINATFRQVGIATGVAAWGAIFQTTVNDRAQQFAAATAPLKGGTGYAPLETSGDFADFISFGVYRRLGEGAIGPGRDAFLHGFDRIVLAAGIVAVVGGILCLLLIRPKDFVAHGVEEGGGAAA